MVWFEGRTVPARRVAYQLARDGKAIPARTFITPKCGNDLCVCPGCLVGRIGRRASRPASMQRRINSAMARRARSRITDEMVADIRASSDSLDALADRYGISRSYAYQLRRMTARPDYSSPFAGLAAGLLRTP